MPQRGPLSVSDEYIGQVTLSDEEFHACDSCGERVFSFETAKKLDSERSTLLQQAIQKQPIEEFLSSAQTADYLGISRQALSKNRRIQRGFIFFYVLDEKKLFLKKSVELFKEKGDGRFLLAQIQEDYSVESSIKTGAMKITNPKWLIRMDPIRAIDEWEKSYTPMTSDQPMYKNTGHFSGGGTKWRRVTR